MTGSEVQRGSGEMAFVVIPCMYAFLEHLDDMYVTELCLRRSRSLYRVIDNINGNENDNSLYW